MSEKKTISERLLKDIEKLFAENGYELTPLRKRWYSEWPDGIIGDKIKKETNALIQSYKAEAEAERFEGDAKLGTIEINGQDVDFTLKFAAFEQISTVNDRYHSLFTTSYSNVDKHLCNPTFISAHFSTSEIEYKSTDVAVFAGGFVHRFEVNEALESMEGYSDETVEFYGKHVEKEELEALLKECDDENVFETYTDTETFRFQDGLDIVKNKTHGLKLDQPRTREQLVAQLEYIGKYQGNVKHMTKEQEELLEKYPSAFEYFKNETKKKEEEAGITGTKSKHYYEIVQEFIAEYNMNVDNSKKIDIKTVRPGFELIQEVTPEIKANLIKTFKRAESLCSLEKNTKKDGKKNQPPRI